MSALFFSLMFKVDTSSVLRINYVSYTHLTLPTTPNV